MISPVLQIIIRSSFASFNDNYDGIVKDIKVNEIQFSILAHNNEYYRKIMGDNDNKLEKIYEKKDIIEKKEWNYKIVSYEEKIISGKKFEPSVIEFQIESILTSTELGNWGIDGNSTQDIQKIVFSFKKIFTQISDFQKISKYKEIYTQTINNLSSDFPTLIEKLIDKIPSGENKFEIIIFPKKNVKMGDLKDMNLKDIVESLEKSNIKKIYFLAKLLLKNQDPSGELAKQFKWDYSLKQLVNQPRNFSFETYTEKILPKINEYFISDKADGERGIIWISSFTSYDEQNRKDYNTNYTKNKIKEYKKTNKSNEVNHEVCLFTIDYCINITNILDLDWKEFTGNTILDAEIIALDIQNKRFEKAYIFDVLMINGKSTTNLVMEEREKEIDRIEKYLGKKISKKSMTRLSNDPKSEDYYKTQIKNYYEKYRLYEIDGLIFTPNFADKIKYNRPENYFDMLVYKWKIPAKNTIDFLAIKYPEQLLGIKPFEKREGFTLYILFCGIKSELFSSLNLKLMQNYNEIIRGIKYSDKYFPIQFYTNYDSKIYLYYHPNNSKISNDELDHHIGEFIFKSDEWHLIKIRKDKEENLQKGVSFGNDYKTVEETYILYKHPFSISMLIGEKTGSGIEINNKISESMIHPIGNNDITYFQNKKEKIYSSLTKFNLFVKAQLIRQLDNANWIMDLASGRGADLFTYNTFHIHNGVFLDKDEKALIELEERKYNFNDDSFYKFGKRPEKNITIYTKQIDLTESVEKLIPQIVTIIPEKQKMNAILINFALHYIIDSKEKARDFINLVDHFLLPGGLFIFTCFNGKVIYDLLKKIKKGQSWDITDNKLNSNNTLKYSIKKLYSEKKFEPFGLKISVIHPFSQGEYYEENLIGINELIELFQEKGFLLRQNGSFAYWLGKFKQFSPHIYQNMTQEDKMYSSLYQYVSLWKELK